MSVDVRRRGSARPIRKRHHNSLPRTCLEAALGSSCRCSVAEGETRRTIGGCSEAQLANVGEYGGERSVVPRL